MIKEIRHRKNGFTLIELLIVVAIIGVLATLLMANFVGVRQRARDAQRKGDVRQIQSALELYRSDQGQYPQPGIGVTYDYQSDRSPSSCTNNGSIVNGSTVYMKKIPCDPSGDTYMYSPAANGMTYTLIACMENSNDKDIEVDASGNKVPCSGVRSSRWHFTVYNP